MGNYSLSSGLNYLAVETLELGIRTELYDVPYMDNLAGTIKMAMGSVFLID